MAAQIVQNPQPQNLSEPNRNSRRNASQHSDMQGNGDLPASARKRNGEHSGSGWDQNPQLLQWRANNLLDEMMLGAVDIGASDAAPLPPSPRPARSSSADYHTDEGLSNRRTTATQDPRSAAQPPEYPPNKVNGVHRNSEQYNSEPYDLEPPTTERTPLRDPQDEWSRPAWHFADPTVAAPVSSSAQLPPTSPLTPSG